VSFTKLSILIPAYNEENRLQSTLIALYDFINSNQIVSNSNTEVLIANDGSIDNTAILLEELKKNLPLNILTTTLKVNKGKGFALRTLMAQAKGEYVITNDADMAISWNFISLFLETMQNNSNIDILIVCYHILTLSLRH
jgi:glycosyltransferase involved in cell wall biosynthesis